MCMDLDYELLCANDTLRDDKKDQQQARKNLSGQSDTSTALAVLWGSSQRSTRLSADIYWHGRWSAPELPHRWISLFYLQIRLTIMGGWGSVTREDHCVPTDSGSGLYLAVSQLPADRQGVWKQGHSREQQSSQTYIKSQISFLSRSHLLLWSSPGSAEEIECSIVSANAVELPVKEAAAQELLQPGPNSCIWWFL